MRSRLLPFLALLVVLVVRAGDASAATVPCPTPKLADVLLETPEVVVTKGETDRRGGVRTWIDACDVATGRTLHVGMDLGQGDSFLRSRPVAALGRRILMSEHGWYPGDDGTQVRLFDLANRQMTKYSALTGRYADDLAAAGPAGLLAYEGVTPPTTTKDDVPQLALRTPGSRATTLAWGTLDAIALGARTAYWLRDDAVSARRVTPLPTGAPGVPRPSPRGVRGRCEPRGSRTLLRFAGTRVLRRAGGGEVACGARGRTFTLTSAVPGARPAGPVRAVRPFGGSLASYRYAVTGGRTALVVLDLRSVRVAHAAVVGGSPADVAFDPPASRSAAPTRCASCGARPSRRSRARRPIPRSRRAACSGPRRRGRRPGR